MTRARASLLGVIAILLWATNSAATVQLVHRLGPLTSLALVCGLAGVVLALAEAVRQRRAEAFLCIGWRFGLLGGTCFVVTQGLFFAGFALAEPAMAMSLNLVNYLWPSLTVLLCVLTDRSRFRLRPLALAAGLLAGLAGIVIATCPDPSLNGLAVAFGRCPIAFLAMAGAAVAWAVFSALAVPLRPAGATSGTPLFFLLAALGAGLARMVVGETTVFAREDLPLLIYAALAPSAAGYLLWELAMRHGDVPLLGALSNSLPLLSTLVLWLMMGVHGDGSIGWGATLVGLGAWLVHTGARPVAAAAPAT